MSLSTHIHTLTAPHLTSTPLGIEREPALIVQLEAAIKPDKGGGKSNSNGKGDLINFSALALWEEITADVGIHTMEAGLHTYPDRLAMLRGWTVLEGDSEWGDFLEHVCLDWIDRIRALLSPIKPYHPATPCPACGVQHHGEDRTPPLNVHHIGTDGRQLHPHEWTMDCAACGAQWQGDTLGLVARAMSAQHGVS